jgi:single-strand DNA-binding protein
MQQYLHKGRPVFIEGKLRLDQWQDQQGNNRSKLKVVVDDFQFVDSRGGDGASGGAGYQQRGGGYQQGQQQSPPQQSAAPASGGYEPVSEDDIPF